MEFDPNEIFADDYDSKIRDKVRRADLLNGPNIQVVAHFILC